MMAQGTDGLNGDIAGAETARFKLAFLFYCSYIFTAASKTATRNFIPC